MFSRLMFINTSPIYFVGRNRLKQFKLFFFKSSLHTYIALKPQQYNEILKQRDNVSTRLIDKKANIHEKK